jgi:hypothetical protein
MSVLKCSHHEEVRALLMQGHWPDACAADLREHVAACRECSEMVLVTAALRKAREVSAGRARLEPASLIWWRAQLRKRQAAMETVRRPIWGAQIFAIAMTLSVALGVVAFEARRGDGWRGWIAAMAQMGTSFSTVKANLNLLPVAVSVAMLLFLCGVVVWLTAERE